jgi:hypothetical protein
LTGFGIKVKRNEKATNTGFWQVAPFTKVGSVITRGWCLLAGCRGNDQLKRLRFFKVTMRHQ